jgi:hypothetical protein
LKVKGVELRDAAFFNEFTRPARQSPPPAWSTRWQAQGVIAGVPASRL